MVLNRRNESCTSFQTRWTLGLAMRGMIVTPYMKLKIVPGAVLSFTVRAAVIGIKPRTLKTHRQAV